MDSKARLQRVFGSIAAMIVGAGCGGSIGSGSEGAPQSDGGAVGDGSVARAADGGVATVLDPPPDVFLDGGTFHRDSFTESLCTTTSILDGVETREPFDFVELLELAVASTPAEATWRTLGHRGVACGGASDPARCLADLATARSFRPGTDTSGWSLQPGSPNGFRGTRALVTTKGDVVTFVSDAKVALALFAPVRTPATALFLVRAFSSYRIVCDESRAQPGGPPYRFLVYDDDACSQQDVVLELDGNGASEVVWRGPSPLSGPCSAGRRPEGLEERPAAGPSAVATWLADTAYLEAASVVAFERLADTLVALGAPRSLVERARVAAEDERRHAVTMGALAGRFGGVTRELRVADVPVPSVYELARDNAVEGCVKETYAALVAALQAKRATAPGVAVAMATVAEEELSHAAFSWDLDAWLSERLSEDERGRVRTARVDAFRALRHAASHAPHPDCVTALGAPSADEAVRIVDALAGDLLV
ncbi:MAG: hypothetical protein U0169_04210 [Polyangiaceae bacterium]